MTRLTVYSPWNSVNWPGGMNLQDSIVYCLDLLTDYIKNSGDRIELKVPFSIEFSTEQEICEYHLKAVTTLEYKKEQLTES